MTYLLEIKETKESKSLLEHLRTLKYVTIKKEQKPAKAYRFTDEEMAMPGINPTQEQFEQWVTSPDKDKGSDAEVVRKRLLKKLQKDLSAPK